MRMEPIEGSETSAIINQTPGNYPKGNLLKIGLRGSGRAYGRPRPLNVRALNIYTVIPQLTKIIRSGITFVSRNLR